MDRVELLLLITYVLYVVSPMIRDDLALRTLLLTASLGFVVWGIAVGERVTILANVFFVLLSLRHIIGLLQQRRPVTLGDEQERVYQALFSAMSKREFKELWELGERSTADAGPLIRSGDDVEEVLVVLDAPVYVELDGGDLELAAPSILGEMSYALGETASATASVRLDAPAEVLRWTKSTLRDLKHTNPGLEVPFLAALGSNLARKIAG